MIYSLAALLGVMLLSVALGTGLVRSSQQVYVNEVMTQMPGVGYEILDDIGRRDLAFDEATNEENFTPPVTYPLINSPSQLTTMDSDFWGACASADYFTCPEDIDDFDGMKEIVVERDSLFFTASIEVQYVDGTTLAASAVPTYAKEVAVTVSSDAFRMPDGEVFAMTVSRIFTYDKITEFP